MEKNEMTLSVAFSTWNVGAAAGADVAAAAPGVDGWLKAGGSAPSDIHIVTLQEVVDINSALSYASNPFASVSLDGLSDSMSAEAVRWEIALCAQLPAHRIVAKKQLVGMVLFVFVLEVHLASCASVRVASLGTGPLGAGNKGAVAASLSLYGSAVAVVGSHLAAGSKGAHLHICSKHHARARHRTAPSNACLTHTAPRAGPSARNRDMATITASLAFPSGDAGGNAGTLPVSLAQHEHVLWGGDLNYRIMRPDDEVRALASVGGDLSSLIAADELRLSLASGDAWGGYAESALTFAPTYKFDLHSDAYDTSAKRRAPAWTDRILWRASSAVSPLAYTRHGMRESDHRPVSASFTLKLGGGSWAVAEPTTSNPCVALVEWLRSCFRSKPPEGYMELS